MALKTHSHTSISLGLSSCNLLQQHKTLWHAGTIYVVVLELHFTGAKELRYLRDEARTSRPRCCRNFSNPKRKKDARRKETEIYTEMPQPPPIGAMCPFRRKRF
ncbi:hypothetical protein ISCGN_030746 [Ixodes scapularis]